MPYARRHSWIVAASLLAACAPLSPRSEVGTASAIGDQAAAAETILAGHNAFRAKHCVKPLAWSDALAAAARAWAEKCTMQDGKFVHSGVPGENLHWSWPAGREQAGAIAASWYKESGKYDFAHPGFSPGTAHFTQLIWKGSTELGCAKAVCGDGKYDFWVCRYAPVGNMRGQFPANVPKPCK